MKKIILLAIISLFSGLVLWRAPLADVTAQLVDYFYTDPDMGPLKSGMTKEEFMVLRSQYVGLKRGISDGIIPDRYQRNDAIKEMARQEDKLAKGMIPGAPDLVFGTWTPIGPAPIPNGQTDTVSTPVSGRVTAIAIHPTNTNIVYAGTAQGGVYRTTDAGTNWTPIFDNAMSLAIGALALAPSQPETLYVGTGEPNFSLDSFFGVGLYRIDNASTAATLNGPFNQTSAAADIFTGRSISEVIVHPTNPATIFVATTSGVGGITGEWTVNLPNAGVYRSTNATSASPTFTQIGVASASDDISVRDIAIDPADPNILIASRVVNGGGIYRSTNALAATPSFTKVLAFSGNTSSLTAEFAAIHPAGDADATFYAATGFGGGRVYRSTDGGANWTLRVDNDFCGGQCFYDIAIDVDPTNVNTVYLGGDPSLVAAKSTDGGAAFTDHKVGLHVDTHAISVAKSNTSHVWLGTDGGIYRSTDGGLTWATKNNSQFSATQFMGLDIHPTDPNFTIGGTQDNGTNFYRPDGTWTRVDYGDGGWAVIDQNAANNTNVRMYHTYFNRSYAMGYARVTNVGNATDGSWSVFGCGFEGITANGMTCSATSINFYAPMERGPGNPNTLYFGSDVLYRSSDGGTNMTKVSQDPIDSGDAISAIGISPQNDNVRIVGLNNGALWGTNSGSSTLTNLDSGGIIPDVPIGRAVIDPNSQNTAYITLSAFGEASVWKTTNLNNANPTWTAAAGTGPNVLPQVPVNGLVVDPLNSDYLFAGTDVGVFVSTDGGSSWLPFGSGLPRVAVFDLAIASGTPRTLRIATHGRGMWEIPAVVPSPTSVSVGSSANPSVFGQSVAFAVSVATVPPGGMPTGTVTVRVDGSAICTTLLNISSQAMCSTSAMSVGSHTITVDYASNSPAFLNSSDSMASNPQIVNKASTTVTINSDAPDPSVFGQNYTVNATVAVNAPGSGSPTGSIAVNDGGGNACTINLPANSCVLPSNSVGLKTLTATYGGNANFNGSSDTEPHQVDKANTTTSVTSSPNPTVFGQSVTFTATVAAAPPGAGIPSGMVAFMVDGNSYCQNTPLQNVGGQMKATCVLAGLPALPAGNRVIVGQYFGDTNFNGSVGGASGGGNYIHVVTKAVTTIAITSDSPDPTLVNEPYTVSWSVGVSPPGVGSPGGTVTASDGTGATCSAPVAAGNCVLVSTTIGSKTLSAAYSGDVNFLASDISVPAAHLVSLRIAGVIRQYLSNTPVPGVTVTLTGTGAGGTMTDASGAYSFTGQFSGAYVVAAVPNPQSGRIFDPLSRTYTNVLDNIANANFMAFDDNEATFPRVARIVNSYTVPGQTVTVPIVLESLGNEASFAMNVAFDINPFVAPPAVSCGSSVPACILTTDYSTTGRVGFSVTPLTPLSPGTREIATLTFQSLFTNLSNTPLTFESSPVPSGVFDSEHNPLAVKSRGGYVVFQQGLEGDVGAPKAGDGEILANDVTLTRRMVVGSLVPDPDFNEFQRADTAPVAARGDGILDATDVMQSRLFVLRINEAAAAGGPFRPISVPPPSPGAAETRSERTVSVLPAEAFAGQRVSVGIAMDAQGDETASNFTIGFDPLKLANPSISLGEGAPADSVLTYNTDSAAEGKLFVLVDSPTVFARTSGLRLVTVSFDVRDSASSGETAIDISGGSVSDATASPLPVSFHSGTVNITGSNSAAVEISGRVVTSDGNGLRNAQVTLTDQTGARRTVSTSAFGYYRIDGLAPGAPYTLSVYSKRYRFAARTVTPASDLAGFDFVGRE